MKLKTMKLVGPVLHPTEPDPKCYRVMQVTDSLVPEVGAVLTRKEADDYCHSREWKVTIVGL